MWTFKVPYGLIMRPSQIEAQIKAMMIQSDPIGSGTATAASFENDVYRYEVRGTDLTYDADGLLIDGAVNSMTAIYKSLSGYEMRFRNIALDLDGVVKALEAEADGLTDRLETLLFRISWKLIGNGAAERFEDGQVSEQGVAISLSGDNLVRLGAGADWFETGAGRDTVQAGSGDDYIDGGRGNDVIAGGRGSDRLVGAQGGDELHGGVGPDVLVGGRGADTLIGGRGADTLTGGPGADVFQFEDAAGNDTITKFQPGIDRIELTSMIDPVITETDRGLRIEMNDGGTILVEDYFNRDVVSGDIILYDADPV